MRESVKAFKNLGKDLIGVEIGVLHGENALTILQNTDIKMLYLVDPYIRYDGYNIMEISSTPDMEENEVIAAKRLLPFEDRITWIKHKSHDAVIHVPNDLDFVYIDANHSGDAIREDVKDWYPKVKQNGILAGHDFQKEAIRHTVLKLREQTGDDLWSFPFKEPNWIHNWQREWEEHKVPSDRISIDQEDWWVIRK